MADKRISQLVERINIANNDVLPIVASGATTTNKVTISTIQDWMQDNLDVGVTSVGITLGTTGTNINVIGSPVTSSGNITINIPTASATNRGALSSTDWTTFNNKLSSVGLTMPSAFNVSNSPLTANGTIAVTGAGTVAQYIRGDGSLADFPEGGGGGASVSYYLNGSVSQGTIGGIAYLEMNKVPIFGAGTDITISSNGYVASFITDANDPSLLEIPAGNWNFETYLSASSGGGSPTFYIELYKVNSGGTATLIASNSGTPESISLGTNINPYFSALAVPTTSLALTDRLAIRIYVTPSGRTITLHTENGHLCQIITTFTTGLTALNGLTAQVQNFATGTSGTDFNISSASSTHTFNLPDASASNRGAVTTGSQVFAGVKTFSNGLSLSAVGGSNQVTRLVNIGTLHEGSATLNQIGFNSANNIYFGKGLSNGGVIQWTNAAVRYYTLPDADGTLALASQLGAYLPLSGGTLTGALNGVNASFTSTISSQDRISTDTIFSVKHNSTVFTLNGYNSIQGNLNSFAVYNGTKGMRINFPSNESFTYSLPDASGTLALTSNIPTNPVGGTGTTNQIPKFTASSTIGNSNLSDDGSAVTCSTELRVLGALNGTTASLTSTGTHLSLIRSTFNTFTFAVGTASGISGLLIGNNTAGTTPLIINQSGGAATFSSSVNVGGTSANTDFRVYRIVDPSAHFFITAPGGDPLTSILGISGTNIMSLRANGNVGIGTTSAEELLDIRGANRDETSAQYNQVIYSTSTHGINRGGSIGLGGTTNGTSSITAFGAIKGGKENDTAGNTAGALSFLTRVNGGPITEKMRLSSTGALDTLGRITITADAGNEQFNIRRAANTNQQLIFGYHSDGYGRIQAIEQNVAFRPLVLNQSGGNVGINTASPTRPLDVNGSARANSFASTTGRLAVPSSTFTTFFTPSVSGLYLARVYLSGNNSQFWSAVIMFEFNASTILVVNQTNGINVSTNVSGTNIQVRQIGGSTFDFDFEIIRIG